MKILSLIFIPSMAFLFLLFFKMGLVFFGGGYVAIPLMHRELVSNLHLLTEQQFIDGVAISQITPGPVAILATFAGYCISGLLGALTATFAMFLPGASLMFFLSKNYDRIKNSETARKILNTIIPVIIGLLLAAAWQIGQGTIRNKLELAVFFTAYLLISKFKINPALLILISALLGFILHF